MIPLLLLSGLVLASTEPAASANGESTPPLLEMADPGDAAVHASLVVQVSDRDAAAQRMVDAAEAAGGWFAELGGDAVTVRVPRSEVRSLLGVAGSLGDVVDESFVREDLTARLADLRGTAASRDKVLDRYLSVLEEASPKAVVSVEREITKLVAELERLRGQIKLLEHRAAYGVVEVSFRFRDRAAPVNDGTSSFAWINTLDASQMLSDVQEGWRADRSAATAVVPEGFAPFAGPRRFQALSASGVVYRVRSAQHRPEAALSFWQEAVSERMVAAGYTLVEERTVTAASGQDGVVFHFAAANGERDLTYLLGIFLGRRIVLAEAVGDAEAAKVHLPALYEAMEGLRL